MSGITALLPLAALLAIVAVLFWKAYPAIRYNGFGFFVRTTWRPGNTYANPLLAACSTRSTSATVRSR